MKDYPREIMIRDSLWAIRFVRKPPGTTDRYWNDGLCDPSANTIYIRLGLDEHERFKTFVHEILHALEHEYELELPHHIVHALEEPILRILLDNGLISF